MGAVSGDVNTGSFSVANAADLTSRPTAALRSGDRAYVTSKAGTAEGPLFFLDKDSVQVIDGVGVLATNSGVGRWLSEALYGAVVVPEPAYFPSFANVAALAAYDDAALADGTQVWVESMRAYWQKRVEADRNTDDNITNIRNPSNTASWYRGTAPNGTWSYLWSANGAVHVDTANGDDENDGLTANTALKSVNEFSRRIASDQVSDSLFFRITVGVGGLSGYVSGSQNIVQTLVAPEWAYIDMVGMLTVASAQSNVTAATPRDMATVPQTTAQRQTAIVAALNFWEIDQIYLNQTQNQYGWALSGAASAGFGGDNADTFFENDPQLGDLITGYTMPLVDGLQVQTGIYSVLFRHLNFGDDVVITSSTNPTFRECLFDASQGVVAYLSKEISFENTRFRGSLFPGVGSRMRAGTSNLVFSWCVIEGDFAVLCQSARFYDCSCNGANVAVGNATIRIGGSTAFVDAGLPKQVNFRNVELRDNAYIVAGAADNNGSAVPLSVDLYFEGNFAIGDTGYLYGVNDNVTAEPLQLLNAGIRAWYNSTNSAGGAPVAPAATQFTMTSAFATDWLRVAATGVWAALPSIGVAATEFMSAIAPYDS